MLSWPGKNRKRLAVAAAVVLIVGAIGMFRLRPAASKPAHLGVTDGKLADCPGSPNCVSTQAADARFRMEPIPFSGDSPHALNTLRSIVESMPRCRVTECGDGYLHAEFSSRLLRFVDDVEFLIDEPSGQIHFRSASRTGYSDLGVNRRRMERIRGQFMSRSEGAPTN